MVLLSDLRIYDVKITVLKRIENTKISEEFAARKRDLGPCTRVKEGQEFVSKNMQIPESFCSWAWADIQRDVVHLATGGNVHWINRKGIEICSCTDGLHPVIYKLERIECPTWLIGEV